MKLLFFLSIILWAANIFASESTQPIATPNRSVIEGTLQLVSKLPTAKDNPYPDCYYTAVIDTKYIVSGTPIPKKVILVLPGFFSREYAPEAIYKAGDKVRAVVVPFSWASEEVRQTQQADDIEDVELEIYLVETIVSVPNFTLPKAPIPFAADRKTSNHTSTYVVDTEAKAARRIQIQQDLETINKLLAEQHGDWDSWYRSLNGFRSAYQAQYRAKAQKWIGNSFFSAGQVDTGKVYSAEFIKSVVDFKNYLARQNVDLILVRIPNKGEIVDDLFAPLLPNQVSNPYLLRLYKELLEADVEIITNIIPQAKAARTKYPLMYYYQDFDEIHPAEGMAWVVAEALAHRVNRYKSVTSLQKKPFKLKEVAQPTKDFKWPEGNLNFKPTEYVRFSAVTDGDGKALALKQGIDSPVLVLGSSFIAYPSIYKSGSIPHYLAYLTGVIPDIVYRSGADRTIPRSIAREGDEFLRGRSVCLFPFIPSTSYTALSSPPIFNPDKSPKSMIASYSGPNLNKVVELGSVPNKEIFSYSNDGMLSIGAVKGRGVLGNIRIHAPDTIANFPFFYMDIEFTSRDITSVTVNFSDQSDSTFRSDTQLDNTESFAFVTKPEKSLDVKFVGSSTFVRAVTIKSITFYGVNSPIQ